MTGQASHVNFRSNYGTNIIPTSNSARATNSQSDARRRLSQSNTNRRLYSVSSGPGGVLGSGGNGVGGDDYGEGRLRVMIMQRQKRRRRREMEGGSRIYVVWRGGVCSKV
jgi:hypothetical protein